jgi:hypothetical protein
MNTRLSACVALLSALCSCSLVDPRVGPAQASCTAEGSGYGSGTGYGTDAGASCAADSGSGCDDCESAHCCATRLACYGDAVCGCADKALDPCLEAAGDDAAADASDTVARCWSAFTATGGVAQARVSCQRTWCKDVCGIP